MVCWPPPWKLLLHLQNFSALMGRFPQDPALLIKWNETIFHYSCQAFTQNIQRRQEREESAVSCILESVFHYSCRTFTLRIFKGDKKEKNWQSVAFWDPKLKGFFKNILCNFFSINLGNFSKILLICKHELLSLEIMASCMLQKLVFLF